MAGVCDQWLSVLRRLLPTAGVCDQHLGSAVVVCDQFLKASIIEPSDYMQPMLATSIGPIRPKYKTVVIGISESKAKTQCCEAANFAKVKSL